MSQTSDKKPLALIIEDDPELGDIFAKALQMAGFETETIQDGRVAVVRLTASQPAIVVLDLHLPRVSGKEILRQIRAEEQLAKTRVILATADPLLAETMREEADLVLIKPISFQQLRHLASRLRPPDIVIGT